MFLQFLILPKLWRESRGDFFIWISSFLGVLIFGVVGGLSFGVMVLIINLIRNNFSSRLVLLNPYPNSEYYFENGEVGIIFEFRGPLNFISAENLSKPPKGS